MNCLVLMQLKGFTLTFGYGIFLFLLCHSYLASAQEMEVKDVAAFQQTIDLKEFTSLLDLSKVKLETHLQKKGFKRNYYSEQQDIISFIRLDKKEKKCKQAFQVIPQEKDYALTYKTSYPEEYTRLKEEMIRAGYASPRQPIDTSSVLYQRWGTRIESSVTTVDSTIWYQLKATKRLLPKMKDILAAEDLLQLDAQQYLEAIFGKENVKTDLFYFTETESNKCSVLFPNSSKEAIFVWNDESNLKDLAFILIGGSLKPRDKLDNINAVAPNAWHSRQGIYCGMSLREIQLLNKQPVRFYSWQTESAGYLAPGNKGLLDFDHLGIIFNCLNCAFPQKSHEAVLDSKYAMEADLKVFVNSMIILPSKKSH